MPGLRRRTAMPLATHTAAHRCPPGWPRPGRRRSPRPAPLPGAAGGAACRRARHLQIKMRSGTACAQDTACLLQRPAPGQPAWWRGAGPRCAGAVRRGAAQGAEALENLWYPPDLVTLKCEQCLCWFCGASFSGAAQPLSDYGLPESRLQRSASSYITDENWARSMESRDRLVG